MGQLSSLESIFRFFLLLLEVLEFDELLLELLEDWAPGERLGLRRPWPCFFCLFILFLS